MLFHLCTDGVLGWVRNVSVIVNPLTSGEIQQYAQAETCALNQITPMQSLLVLVWTLSSFSCLLFLKKKVKKLTQITGES